MLLQKLLKVIITVVITSLLPLFSLYPQTGWFHQDLSNLLNQNVNLTKVKYLNENTLISVGGGNGVIKKSIDGGNTWFDVANNLGTLWDISFINEETGYVCGNIGVLLRTTNSGENWNSINTFTNNRLWSVNFVNENTGYVSGSNGLTLKTTNSGTSWISTIIPNASELRKILFINEDIGFIAAYSGIYKTTTGGQSWELSFSEGLGFIDLAIRNDTIIGVGNRIIARSVNLGNSWVRTASVLNHIFVGVDFISNSKIIAVGQNGSIALSLNSGVTWFETTNNNWLGFLSSVSFINESTGVIVGGDSESEIGERGIIQKTTNGAQNWEIKLINTNTTSVINFQSVCLLNPDIIWIGTSNGLICNSNNGGMNWNTKNVTTFAINKVRFYNQNIGIITCNSGRLLRTSNSGSNWTTVNLGSSISLNDIAFKSESEFFISASSGYVFKSTNGGQSFSQTIIGNNHDFKAIDVKENLIITGGANGKIYKSIDSGISWSEISINTSTTINDIQILNNNTYILCGNGGMIRKTMTGGANWINLISNTPHNLNAMYFLNENSGYIAGAKGIILHTQNSGITWIAQNSTTTNNLVDIYFADENFGNAVGNNDIVLRTITGGTINISILSIEIPDKLYLFQNYPNPFNSNTNIRFAVPNNENIKLEIFNVQGQLIKILINEFISAGFYEFSFNAQSLSSGVYYCRIKSESFFETRKMMILK